jgi:hypothetical protein
MISIFFSTHLYDTVTVLSLSLIKPAALFNTSAKQPNLFNSPGLIKNYNFYVFC